MTISPSMVKGLVDFQDAQETPQEGKRMNKPYIIAEVGSNFKTVTDCKNSIQLAKRCGADAVKFQLYDHKALYGYDGEIRGALKPDSIPELAEKAQAFGIDFMCTAFSPELFDVVDPFVKMHKIASSEACHVGLLKRARASGKPVVISFGGHTIEDMRRVFAFMAGVEVFPLYCVPEYPAYSVDTYEADRLIYEFPEYAWGFSDHTKDPVEIPRLFAIERGCSILEKHVNFANVESPDSPHSLSTDEFREMVKVVRGQPYSMPKSAQANAMLLCHKRRVVATRDIIAGEILDPSKCGIYRVKEDDAHGAHPFFYEEMLGKRVRYMVARGRGIAERDLERV